MTIVNIEATDVVKDSREVINDNFTYLDGLITTEVDALQTAVALKADDDEVVKLTTDQTIAGVKTFSSSPIVPTPTSDFQAATKEYADSLPLTAGNVPVGAVFQWVTNSAPSTYLLCDGAAVSRATYSALFAIISTTFGAGDGSTTFNVPDLKGRVPVGRDSGQTEFDTLGETGGAKTHTLSESEMPAHTHDIQLAAHQASSSAGSAEGSSQGLVGSVATSSAGSGAAHNNLQPYIVLNYIIKT